VVARNSSRAVNKRLAAVPRPIELHQRIRADIEGKILSGEWQPGHRLPNEHELMAQYSCARMTVNKVMSGLVTAGLIERRRRAGTFVSRQQTDSAILQIPNMREEVTSRGARYRYRLLARTVRTHVELEAETFEFFQGGPVLELECLHYADDRPFSYERRLISLAAVHHAEEADFSHFPPGTWLMEHVPWSEASHRIGALNADAEIARVLQVAVGEACLLVERRTWRLREGITQVSQFFPGDLYTLGARFAPDGQIRTRTNALKNLH